jgi:hypothetical protein
MRVILRRLRSQAWSQETTLKLATLNKPTTSRFPKLLELVKPEFYASLLLASVDGRWECSAGCSLFNCILLLGGDREPIRKRALPPRALPARSLSARGTSNL